MARPATSTSRLLAGSREPVRVATTGNINPAAGGLLTIDGVTVEPGDRVLVKDQADKRLNGIYGASAGEWYRASDGRSPRSINKGVTVHIAEGTVHEGQTFAFLTPEPEIGIDEIVIGFFLSYDTVGDAETEIEGIVAAATSEIQQIADDAVAQITEIAGDTVTEITNIANYQIARVEQEGNEQVDRVEAAGAAITGIVSPLIIAENTFGTKGSVELWNPETPSDYVRTAGYFTAGDGGGGLYRQVASEPTHAGKIQSADGTWWELAENDVTLEMFGGIGDGVISAGDTVFVGTDNLPAMEAALQYGVVHQKPGWPYYATATIRLLRGKYWFSSTIFINHQVRIVGAAGQEVGELGSGLYFPANMVGIVLASEQTPHPVTGVVPDPPTYSAGTLLENFAVRCLRGGTDRAKHGIMMRSVCSLHGLQIYDFAGDGLHITATVSVTGNANNFKLSNLQILRCHNGVYVDGPDANNGYSFGLDCTANRRWGIWDSSFLGNTWVACHTDVNGLGSTGGNPVGHSSRITYGGNVYYAVPTATEAQYVAVTPGTDETVWHLNGPGPTTGFQPTWVAAQPAGTYFAGGSYYVDGVGSGGVLLGCYAEGGQGGVAMTGGSVALGGFIGTNGFTLGGSIGTRNGNEINLNTPNAKLHVGNGTIDTTLGAGSTALQFYHATTESEAWSWELQYVSGDWYLWNAGSGPRIAMVVTGQNTTKQMGRTTPVPYRIYFPEYGVGDSTNTRMHTAATVAPTTGGHAQGEIVWNVNATAGGKVGWVCTTSGTPGTWKAFGAIDP